MRVFKFGGASVKDAEGIRNLLKIVSDEKENLVIVVSAFGKTTNSLEKVLKSWLSGNEDYPVLLNEIYNYHHAVIHGLRESKGNILKSVDLSFAKLREYLVKSSKGDYDYEYDQVVSYGEVWSTLIIAGFLKESGLNAGWIDIRENLITDDRFRDANILWGESTVRIIKALDFSRHNIYVTQGFIAGTIAGQITTLGREGSDFTAAIIGNILDAEKVVFWKDVPGILNADPNWMTGVTRLKEISYKEAVEMTFSGAKVIHPKTIKPLHNKNIPLQVKSFISPGEDGTVIKADAKAGEIVPIFIRKEDQILISILPKDFSFVMGENLGRVFHSFQLNGIKVNLVQASAVSINVCVDDERVKVDSLIEDLKRDFKAIYNDGVEMLSIQHHTPEAIGTLTLGREILLEQKTRKIVRFVARKLKS